MRKRVILSAFSILVTVLTFAVLAALLIWAFSGARSVVYAWVLVVCVVAWGFFGLFYTPLWVSLSDETLDIERPLRKKRIPLSEIESVKLCAPTMGEKRLCGSGGFLGYWGWFSERDLGKYFAYYGKSSDGFLVTLKNGKKYLLGCKDAPEMVDAIQEGVSE